MTIGIVGRSTAVAKPYTGRGGVHVGFGLRRSAPMGEICERPLPVHRDAGGLAVLGLPDGLSTFRKDEVRIIIFKDAIGSGALITLCLFTCVWSSCVLLTECGKWWWQWRSFQFFRAIYRFILQAMCFQK